MQTQGRKVSHAGAVGVFFEDGGEAGRGGMEP